MCSRFLIASVVVLDFFLGLTVAFQRSLPCSSHFPRVVLKVKQVNGEVPTTQESNLQQCENGQEEIEQRRIERSDVLLMEALQSFNSSAAKALISQIDEIRNKINNDKEKNSGQAKMSQLLDQLLLNGPDSTLPVWSRLRILSRFSKRAKLRSLRRLIDFSTPPPSEEQQGGDDTELRKRRRRQALLSVIRALSNEAEFEVRNPRRPAVVELEKRARQASVAGSGSEDIKGRIPSGLETPKYSVIAKKKAARDTLEIRRYESFSVCSVGMNKARPANSEKTDAKVSLPQLSGASSFGALAGYLFGKNQDSKAMKMTTPVLMTGEGESRQMSFVLPSDYWGNGLKVAPKPYAESGVTVEEVQGCERATLMFGGYSSKKVVEKRKKQLLDALAKDVEWDAVEEPVSTAQYNDPFTPPWKRLNEVSIGVVARDK